MDDLENLLSKQKVQNFQFSDNFTQKVLSRIDAEDGTNTKNVKRLEHRVWYAAAACVAAVLISMYTIDGSISVDSLLGLSQYSQSEMSQSIEMYAQWDFK